jgi:hypothetical protein
MMAEVGLRWWRVMPRKPKETPMRKQKSKRQPPLRSNHDKTGGHRGSARTTARTAKKRTAGARSAVRRQQRAPAKQSGRPDSKQARIVAMLRGPNGVTIETMSHATGWQLHSVRGFLAGVVRKKLGLNLISTPADGGRVYRIADRADNKPAAAAATDRT